ncbi:MAG: LamB/YcsF family protein [Candidatus Methylomirabilis oxygeniifera]|uniref:5-oxoprolinase subunit A n=1 Tax=Methylomirabilis oxygeniifera TaxID=671143 RepID=D5MN08_METO1|nr:MAG: LamB/YcsF family protein [Candidatus Methylomirabilis oxyfera]CBE68108.1 putative lactam utilization protein [Candidatus Methylomirabilis oxyfera]
MISKRVDLNSDVGESFGVWTRGNDEALMPSLTSASIACGWHGGDPQVMRRTVRLAKAHGVKVGAHPGFPDLLGFGRRPMQLSPGEAKDYLLYQIGALWAFIQAEGMRLQHVKPHGALYHMAAGDRLLSEAIAEAIAEVDRTLILVGPPGSALLSAGQGAGLRTAQEGFGDRAYNEDGSLVPRSVRGALLTDPDTVADRVLLMLEGKVRAITGRMIPITVDTVCLHGDTPGMPAIATRLRERLALAGVEVVPLEELLVGQVS